MRLLSAGGKYKFVKVSVVYRDTTACIDLSYESV